MQLTLLIPDATLAFDESPELPQDHRSRARIKTEGRKIRDVIQDLNDRIRAIPDENDLHYYDFSLSMTHEDAENVWPTNCRWTACFAAKGSNEGYYVHIETIGFEPNTNFRTVEAIAIAKVEHPDMAIRIAALAFLLLEA